MNTGILTTDTYLNHDTGQGHPERADRVTVVIDHLKKVNSKDLVWKKPEKVSDEILKMTHSDQYIDEIKKSFPNEGLKFLDGDTVISPGSKDAVFDAAGSVIKAINGIEKSEFKNAFCAVRPPGG